MKEKDIFWMQQALALARKGELLGEVPVGAVLVSPCGGSILGEGCNTSIQSADPTAHAEVQALRIAGGQQGNYRLNGTTLYVTLEPCLMCLGAMMHARIKRLVFGAFDAKVGWVKHPIFSDQQAFFNHKIIFCGGVLEDVCAKMLRQFFLTRRHQELHKKKNISK